MRKWRICILGLIAVGAASAESATPKAVKVKVTDGESAVYILYQNGMVQTTGLAVSYGSASGIDAVDLELSASQSGYSILDEEGTVYTFGDAISYGKPIKSRTSYVDMEPSKINAGTYFLNESGSVAVVGEAVFRGELKQETAVDLELTPDEQGYYVLYENGDIITFGSAVDFGSSKSTSLKAKDLELTSNGYFVLYADGTVKEFGHAVNVPLTLPKGTQITDMETTSNGYRLLTTEGEVLSFLQLENLGKISWFADVDSTQPQQVTPTPTIRPTPTPPPTSAYLTFLKSGFKERVVGQLPNGQTLPATLSTGQASLHNGGTFLITAAGEEQPARRIQYFSAAQFGNSSGSGEGFLELRAERGQAVLMGISYSTIGLLVTVQDGSKVVLLLIEGNFEPVSVSSFMTHE